MAKCDICKRERNTEDISYSSAQIIFRKPVGWYSGPDGEMCGECVTKFLDKQ